MKNERKPWQALWDKAKCIKLRPYLLVRRMKFGIRKIWKREEEVQKQSRTCTRFRSAKQSASSTPGGTPISLFRGTLVSPIARDEVENWQQSQTGLHFLIIDPKQNLHSKIKQWKWHHSDRLIPIVVLFPGAKRRQTGPQAFRHTSTYIFVPTSFFPLGGGRLFGTFAKTAGNEISA